MFTPEQINLFIEWISVIWLLTAFSLFAWLLVKGETIADKLIAVDTFMYDINVILCMLGIFFDTLLFIPLAFCLALWAFVTTLYIAKYLERGEVGT